MKATYNKNVIHISSNPDGSDMEKVEKIADYLIKRFGYFHAGSDDYYLSVGSHSTPIKEMIEDYRFAKDEVA